MTAVIGSSTTTTAQTAVLNLNLPDFPFNIIFFCVYELL